MNALHCKAALTQKSEEGFAALVRFHNREGHCLVKSGHLEDGLKLGSWVSRQRTNKGTLTPEWVERLDAIGFVWDPLTHQWEEGFAALTRFKEREGNTLVKRGHLEDGLKLGSWVSRQRTNKGTLTPEWVERLDAISFVWDAHTHQWEDNFAALKRFKEREGNCFVIQTHLEDDLKLGSWVSVQRTNKDTLTSERRQRLDEIGFVWDPFVQQWDDNFAALKRFKEREGHCLVQSTYKKDGFWLGGWVRRQRGDKGTLTSERRQRLDGIGFIWDLFLPQWEDNFAALTRFKEREGNCFVIQTHLEDGIKLGRWVNTQRTNKDTLTLEQIERLDAIDFAWDPLTHQWGEGFAALTQFKEREGHCLVKSGHLEDGLKLGSWVSRQRTNKGTLTRERFQHLDGIGFIWDALTHQWEDKFAALNRFKEREGNCLVKNSHEENGIKLGQWVSDQRTNKDTLTPERIQRLDAIGFVWDARLTRTSDT
jgi:hypothetical protein